MIDALIVYCVAYKLSTNATFLYRGFCIFSRVISVPYASVSCLFTCMFLLCVCVFGSLLYNKLRDVSVV